MHIIRKCLVQCPACLTLSWWLVKAGSLPAAVKYEQCGGTGTFLHSSFTSCSELHECSELRGRDSSVEPLPYFPKCSYSACSYIAWLNAQII